MSIPFCVLRASLLFISLLLLQGCPFDDDSKATLIGHLTGPVIEGITYQADSGSGITDSSGQYEYEEGDNIRFLVGATVLGDTVAAKKSMTTLDLINGAVLYTNTTQVNEVVYSNLNNPARVALYRFHNVLTLLLHLDDDRDPTNGVNISPQVAALFDDVTLDFYLQKTLSVLPVVIRRRLYQAVKDGLLLTVPLPPKGYALDQYYQINNVESNLAVSMFHTTDELNDGSVQFSYYREYDEVGNYIRDAYSVDGQIQRDSRYTYDQLYRALLYTSDNDGDGILDARTTWEYNALGQTLFAYRDTNGDNDGSAQADYITGYEYNELGSLITIITQTDPVEVDGVIAYTTQSSSRAYTFDDDDQLITTVATIDDNNYSTSHYSYHSSGLMLTMQSINTAEGVVSHDSTVTNTYDDNLNLLSKKRVTVGGFSFEDIYTFDEDDHLLTKARDSDVDGNLDSITTYGYNDAGQRITRELDSDADGVANYWYTYTFDEHGNISTRSHFSPSNTEEPSAVYTFVYDQQQNLLSSSYFYATEIFYPERASWRAVLVQPKIEQ
ncbi:MAG: hypothetical protein V7785_06170 [Bermanella sp.]